MVITMIKTIKRIHKEDVVLVKIGEFYHAYGKDACILSYLFSYKLKPVEDVKYTCGFPIRAISKIEAELERNKINYILLDRRNDYEVDYASDNKKENCYDLLEIAYEANITPEVSRKIKLLEKGIAKVKIIDFLLSYSLDKKLITRKKYLKLGEKMNDIIKYITGWLRKTIP